MNSDSANRQCAFPGCKRPTHYNCEGVGRLCSAHNQQWRLRGQLWAVCDRGPSEIIIHGDYAEIILLNPRGVQVAVATIDSADVSIVSKFRWCKIGRNYVMTGVRDTNGRKLKIYLHRMIMSPPDGMDIDHRDGNPLNNRRSNLSVVTTGQNAQNVAVAGREACRNVSYDPRRRHQPWHVRVTVCKKGHFGGRYATREEAIEAAKQLRAKLFTHHNEERHREGKEVGANFTN